MSYKLQIYTGPSANAETPPEPGLANRAGLQNPSTRNQPTHIESSFSGSFISSSSEDELIKMTNGTKRLPSIALVGQSSQKAGVSLSPTGPEAKQVSRIPLHQNKSFPQTRYPNEGASQSQTGLVLGVHQNATGQNPEVTQVPTGHNARISQVPIVRNGGVSHSPTGSLPHDGSPERPKSFHGSQTSTASRFSQLSATTKKSKHEDPDHPTPQKLGKGYASMQTVLTVAALLCVGFMLTCSGVIILATQSYNETFRITGAVFLGIGLASIVLCAILQWKNVLKNVDRLEKQLFAI